MQIWAKIQMKEESCQEPKFVGVTLKIEGLNAAPGVSYNKLCDAIDKSVFLSTILLDGFAQPEDVFFISEQDYYREFCD